MGGYDENVEDNDKEEADKKVGTDSYANIEEDEKESDGVDSKTQETKLSRELLAAQGFTFAKQLRPGGVSGGSLDLYQYHGDDPAIKSLLHDGLILLKSESDKNDADESDFIEKSKIKHAKITFQNEWDNITQLLAKNNSDPELKRPKLVGLQVGDKKFILNECIYQDPKAKKANNLESYIESISNVDKEFSEAVEDKDLRAGKLEASGKQLDKIFMSLVSAQNQLHDHQLLHLDTAPRNYCMLPDGGMKVIDFGASLKMDSEGNAEKKRPYPIIPYAFFDQSALLLRKDPNYSASIKTDLFARRVTMLDTLARYMGLEGDANIEKEIYFKGLPGFPAEGQEIFNNLRKIDDSVRLKNAFKNLMDYAIQLQQQHDIRGDVVMQQLKKLENYLISMPKSSGLAQIRAEEAKSLQGCVLLAKLENPIELTNIQKDPNQFRKFVQEVSAYVEDCKKLNIPEKVSSSPVYQEFCAMKDKHKETQARAVQAQVDEEPKTSPRHR